MFYIKRDNDQKIISLTLLPFSEDQECLPDDHPEVIAFQNPPRSWQQKRAEAYGDAGQQLDILLREGIEGLKNFRELVKQKFPKDE